MSVSAATTTSSSAPRISPRSTVARPTIDSASPHHAPAPAQPARDEQQRFERAAEDAFGPSLFSAAPSAVSNAKVSERRGIAGRNRSAPVPSAVEQLGEDDDEARSNDDLEAMMKMGLSEGEARRYIAEDQAWRDDARREQADLCTASRSTASTSRDIPSLDPFAQSVPSVSATAPLPTPSLATAHCHSETSTSDSQDYFRALEQLEQLEGFDVARSASAPPAPRPPLITSTDPVDYRSETPIPASYPRSSGLSYEPPPTGRDLYTVPRTPSFLTFGYKFLPSDKYKTPLDTQWTEATGRVVDRSRARTLHGDLVNDFGRTVLSAIDSETERTLSSIRSGVTSSSSAISSSTVKSSARRPDSEPLSAETIERAQFPTVSASTMRRAREGRPIKERLSARALESLSEAADQGSSKMATIEAWRRRQKRADAESLAADAARLTGGKKVGMKEAAGIVRQTMLESFGIDLDKEDGPSPPYSESDPTGARTPKPPSDPRARFVPKEIAELLRDFCRLGDLHPPKRDAPESRLPSDYQQSTPFPSTGTKIFSAQVDPVPPRQAAATTSVDRATSSPPAPPAELPPSLPPSWQAPDHFVPRPNNDADEDSDEVYSLAPQDPAEAAFAEASRRRGHSPPKLSAEEKAERRARRKDGRPIDSTGAERDVAWYKMQEFTKEHARLTSLLPSGGSESFTSADVSTLNAIARLNESLGSMQTPQHEAEVAWAYSRSLGLAPDQVEPLSYMARWYINQAKQSPDECSIHLQAAVSCYRQLVDLEPSNAHFRLCLANSLLSQEVAPEEEFSRSMEAAEELMRSVELSHELSDTRVSAFFTLGKVFWKDLARRLEDGDEEKSDMYEKGVRAFKKCKSSMRQLMAAPEDQRAPRTYVPCPSDDFLAETITAISDEWNDYKFEEKMKKYGLGKEAMKRAEAILGRSAARNHVSPTTPGQESEQHRHAPPSAPSAPRTRPAASASQSQQAGAGAGVVTQAKVDDAIRQQQRIVQRAVARGPPRARPRSPPQPRVPVDTAFADTPEARSNHRRDRSSSATHSQRPFDRADAQMEDAIRKLQKISADSREHRAKMMAFEVEQVQRDLELLYDDLLAHIGEQQKQSDELTRSLEAVLKELQGLPERITAQAKLIQLRHENARPVPPPPNPVEYTLTRLRRAKEAVKPLTSRR